MLQLAYHILLILDFCVDSLFFFAHSVDSFKIVVGEHGKFLHLLDVTFSVLVDELKDAGLCFMDFFIGLTDCVESDF